MKQNVCGQDKAIRAAVGVLFILVGLFYSSWWGAIGLIPLGTAVFGYCPLSDALRFSSCRIQTSPYSREGLK